VPFTFFIAEVTARGIVSLFVGPFAGCLTATNKVQRRTIQVAHADLLAGLIKTQQFSA
jgi:hypothetical protein